MFTLDGDGFRVIAEIEPNIAFFLRGPAGEGMPMKVLGIETSCDETAAAVVTAERSVLSNLVLSQIDEHRLYGGVVPEIAARSHLDHLDRLIHTAMDESGLAYGDLDAVAVTAGPGLIGGVIVGLMTAKAIAAAASKPLIAVNHLEGHALTARLTDGIDFPYLLLLVSGGHCQLVSVEGVARYRRLGTTIDDAVGEAFDKTAKMLGLGYPGGPAVEHAARNGDPDRFALPRPLMGRDTLDFSFSGLKNAVRLTVQDLAKPVTPQDAADVAAAFQAAVADVLCDRAERAMDVFAGLHDGARRFVVAGGVAANRFLAARLGAVAERAAYDLHVPPPALCTDNGAMIAWAGLERARAGLTDPLDTAPRARWPLDPEAASAGAKA
jgi:N6-L-threonylcarbamoyladenine synthase